MTENSLLKQIREIIENARTNAVRSVDFCRVQMYWQIGRKIVEEEQGGEARAEYGKYISETFQNSLFLNMAVVLVRVNLNRQGNSIQNIQLRTHCVRNSTGLNIGHLSK